jgi:hypothetical protein
MFRLREVLTLAALAALTAISVASAMHVVRNGLHEPRLGESDLFTLITTTDLLAEPVDIRLRVVRRLEPEFVSGVAWSNRIEALDDEQWELMQDNFTELTRLWLIEKAESYQDRSPGEEQDRFFEAEAKKLTTWGAASLSRGDRSLRKNERGGRRLIRVPELMATGTVGELAWQSNDEAEKVKTLLADALEFFTKAMQNGGLGGIRSPLAAPGGF